MNTIPQDPVLLYSYVNTMLRDHYASLEEFCSANGILRKELEETLASAGFYYDKTIHQFR